MSAIKLDVICELCTVQILKGKVKRGKHGYVCQSCITDLQYSEYVDVNGDIPGADILDRIKKGVRHAS